MILLFIAGSIGIIWAFQTVEDPEFLALFENPTLYKIGLLAGVVGCFVLAFAIMGYRNGWFYRRGGWALDRKLKKPSKQATWDALKPNIITGIVFTCVAPIYMWAWGPLYFRTYSNGVDIRPLPLMISFVVFFFVGVFILKRRNLQDFSAKSSIWGNYSPIYKTKDQTDAYLTKVFYEKYGYNYTKQRCLYVLLFAGIVSVEALFFWLWEGECINFLIASVGTYLPIPFVGRQIRCTTYEFIAERFKEDKIKYLSKGNSVCIDPVNPCWTDYVCPSCDKLALCYDYTKDRNVSHSLGSTTSTVTDKYSNGYSSVYVERQETSYHINENTSACYIYRCKCCKKTKERYVYYRTKL